MQIQACVREAEGDARQKVVLLHGLGSNEEDMFGLACELDPGMEFVCLRAPFAYGPGFAWFPIDWDETGIRVDQKAYWDAVDLVAELLPQVGEGVILGGFSQGAMITLGVLSKYPDRVSGAILLSGRGLDEPLPKFEGKIFQGHGELDELIPFAEGEALRSALEAAGNNLEFHAYPMGHTVCEEEIVHLNAWLAP